MVTGERSVQALQMKAIDGLLQCHCEQFTFGTWKLPGRVVRGQQLPNLMELTCDEDAPASVQVRLLRLN